MEDLLNLIIDYKMSKMEAKAWKISIMYMQLAQKHFPDYTHYKLDRKYYIEKKRDPRKTNLFRYCYKLVREFDDLLKDNEYRLYISAQLQILKNIELGDLHAMINPSILVGPKAWKRWLVWKKKFDIEEIPTAKEAGVNIHKSNKIFDELKTSKEFLLTKFSELKKKNIIDALESRVLFRWIALKHVTPYYLVLSPLVKEWIEASKTDILENFTIDLNFYRPGATQEVIDYFKKEFSYEFINIK